MLDDEQLKHIAMLAIREHGDQAEEQMRCRAELAGQDGHSGAEAEFLRVVDIIRSLRFQ